MRTKNGLQWQNQITNSFNNFSDVLFMFLMYFATLKTVSLLLKLQTVHFSHFTDTGTVKPAEQVTRFVYQFISVQACHDMKIY